MYALADLRFFARTEELYGGDSAKNAKLLEFPLTSYDVMQALQDNKEFLIEKFSEERFDMWYSLESVKRGEGLSDDDLKNTELVLLYG